MHHQREYVKHYVKLSNGMVMPEKEFQVLMESLSQVTSKGTSASRMRRGGEVQNDISYADVRARGEGMQLKRGGGRP